MLRQVLQRLFRTETVRNGSVVILLIITCNCGGDEVTPVSNPPPVITPPPPDGTVMIDRAHNNGHRLESTLRPLGNILNLEGYHTISYEGQFTVQSLEQGRVLVISNALHDRNAGGNWSLPTPSAFTETEIEAVHDWVQAGGSMLLIADHMPFPGAAEELAASFGVTFTNGFAFDAAQLQQPVPCLLEHQIQIFRRSDGSLADHVITNGRNATEQVDSVATFTGQAFEPDGVTTSILTFGSNAVSLNPQEAWFFDQSTQRLEVAGWRQGAVAEFGNGRVAFFGEAAMFTQQTCGGSIPMGMNAPGAEQNRQFIINLFRWLFKEF